MDGNIRILLMRRPIKHAGRKVEGRQVHGLWKQPPWMEPAGHARRRRKPRRATIFACLLDETGRFHSIVKNNR